MFDFACSLTCWNVDFGIVNFSAGMVNVELPSSFISVPAQRFCFRTDIFVTACQCDKGIASCQENPCEKATCPAFPEAKCYITFCGECQARWIHEGKEVDCAITRSVSTTLLYFYCSYLVFFCPSDFKNEKRKFVAYHV